MKMINESTSVGRKYISISNADDGALKNFINIKLRLKSDLEIHVLKVIE